VRADLREARLQGANLSEADLNNADLRKANLNSANLTGALLTGVKLAGTILTETELDPHRPKKNKPSQEEQKASKMHLPPYKLLKGDKVWTFWFTSDYHFPWEDRRESNLFDEAAKAEIETLAIDLSEVQRFDSITLSFVILMYKELAQRNINLVLRDPNPTIRRHLRNIMLDQIMKVEFSESQDEEEPGD
jgi:anti-anti-sigma factor